MPNRSFDLNQVNSLVQDYYMKVVRDQFFLTNALFYRLKPRVEIYEGGRAIAAPLSFAPEGGGMQWWAGSDKLDIRVRDNITQALYYRKNGSVPVSLLQDEEDSCRGPEAIMKLVTAKLNIARPTAIDGVGTELFNDGTDPKKIGGLAHAVKASSASHIYGGITTSASLATWWLNQFDTTAYTTGAAATFADVRGFGPIGKMWAKIGRKSGKRPTLLLSNWGSYQDYHDSLVAKEAYFRPQQNTDLVKAGFENVMYRTAVWVVDERAPHDDSNNKEKMYFLHEPAINLYVHSLRNMSWDGWREPVDQRSRTGFIDWAGELCLSERRCHGVIDDITTTATS